MDLNTITVADFKALFRRDFPYLPIYDAAKLYNEGNRTYYPTTQLFYDAIVNGVQGVTPGTDNSKWVVVSDDIDNYVQDADIVSAFAEAKMMFNQAFFTTDDDIKRGFLYITAHFLVNDLRASAAGLSGGGSFAVSSRSVGNVSESYVVPDIYKTNPIFSFYTSSAYGLKYLNMIYPYMVGNIGVVRGATGP